jgi:hypothetical protein
VPFAPSGQAVGAHTELDTEVAQVGYTLRRRQAMQYSASNNEQGALAAIQLNSSNFHLWQSNQIGAFA